MGAARALEAATWTQVAKGVAVRRPSWLAPAATTPPSERPRVTLSVVPRPSANADADAKAKAEAEAAENARRDEENAQREQAICAMSEELETLQRTTAELAATLATARRRMLEASEGELVGLAMAIAKRVVGEAMAADAAQIAGWAREAIATLPARESMVVAISADLAERVRESTWAEACGAHRLEVDPSLPPATCEVRAGAATVEVSVDARLAAIGEAIGAGT